MTRTTSDFAEEGFDHRELARLVRAKRLERVRRGAYRVPSSSRLTPEQTHRDLVAATWPLFRQPSVLSHASAAVLYGLPVSAAQLTRVHVIKPGISSSGMRKSAHSVVHRIPLADEDIIDFDGYLVTSLRRTVTDLVCALAPADGVAVVDSALRLGLDRAELLAGLGRRPGVRGARRVVRFADPRAESRGESVSRWYMAECGIPAPELQVPLCGGRYHADFGWRGKRVVGEFDGAVKYDRLLKPGKTAGQAVMDEKRRDSEIMRDGWWPVHWGWKQLTPLSSFRDFLTHALSR
ncbi:type IV toxin-antitoxin system AbiEi family antitoxin domain-containing protein [Granulicoccus sp. GXG6511]|uniref:type IV toxin-antitoxin system AbiEi family antitoxin domain-containing protein n=1 Tax=Granulicoccus sp. GXG6511 TaxID=3381351 RepID=UPI003D7D3FE4